MQFHAIAYAQAPLIFRQDHSLYTVEPYIRGAAICRIRKNRSQMKNVGHVKKMKGLRAKVWVKASV
jgi:hypothetical protein